MRWIHSQLRIAIWTLHNVNSQHSETVIHMMTSTPQIHYLPCTAVSAGKLLRQEEPLHNPATVDVEQVLTESLFSKRVYLVTTPEVLEVVLQL